MSTPFVVFNYNLCYNKSKQGFGGVEMEEFIANLANKWVEDDMDRLYLSGSHIEREELVNIRKKLFNEYYSFLTDLFSSSEAKKEK